MLTIDSAQAFSTGDLWFVHSAQRALREAQQHLDDAGLLLVGLVAETAWSSDGIRSLNTELAALQGRVAALSEQLKVRQWEVDAVLAA